MIERATTFEQKVIDLVIDWIEGSWCVDVPFVSFGQIQPPEPGQNMPKCPKVVIFRNMAIHEIVNPPFESGAVGTFPCFTNTSL